MRERLPKFPDKFNTIKIAISEFLRRLGNDEVANALWDCFGGGGGVKKKNMVSRVIPKWLIRN